MSPQYSSNPGTCQDLLDLFRAFGVVPTSQTACLTDALPDLGSSNSAWASTAFRLFVSKNDEPCFPLLWEAPWVLGYIML